MYGPNITKLEFKTLMDEIDIDDRQDTIERICECAQIKSNNIHKLRECLEDILELCAEFVNFE